MPYVSYLTLPVSFALFLPLSQVGPVGTVPSVALPFENAPATLDGSLPGDVGFDPCFLSARADLMANYFNGLFDYRTNLSGLEWYREIELMHGRIAQVAALGFVFPGLAHFPGNADVGLDAYAETNPLEAIGSVPHLALPQIFTFMAVLEFKRIRNILEDGPNYMVGDAQRWGQGEGRWNPFGFNYTPEEYAEKQLQETKHGRVAMVGLFGLLCQASASGVGVVEQLGSSLTTPDYVAKAGYFLPEGI